VQTNYFTVNYLLDEEAMMISPQVLLTAKASQSSFSLFSNYQVQEE